MATHMGIIFKCMAIALGLAILIVAAVRWDQCMDQYKNIHIYLLFVQVGGAINILAIGAGMLAQNNMIKLHEQIILGTQGFFFLTVAAWNASVLFAGGPIGKPCCSKLTIFSALVGAALLVDLMFLIKFQH